MTPGQTKLVIDNLSVARQVASRFSRGNMNGHFNDLLSVAYVRLVEAAISSKYADGFDKHAYWQCVYAIKEYLVSTRCGKVGYEKEFPVSLDAIASEKGQSSADALVDWSLRTFPVSNGRKEKGFEKKHGHARCSICLAPGVSMRTHQADGTHRRGSKKMAA